ncbi:MAG: VOC family protein [Solirubrobacterales bacterium]
MRFAYHYGILVFDLDEALPRFESAFGVRFRPPEARALTPVAGDEWAIPPGSEIRFAFSVGSTFPYLELIEAAESGLFGREQGEGMHHVGYWVADLEGVKAEQVAGGMVTEASFADPDGVERVFYARRGPLRVESVNARLRPDYETWLAAGEPREGVL